MLEPIDRAGQEEFIWAMRTRKVGYEQDLSDIRTETVSSLDTHLKTRFAIQQESQTKLYASLVPDIVIYNYKRTRKKHGDACVAHFTINGFLELCVAYSKKTKGGPSKLSQLLNDYLHNLIQDILMFNGDVISIGDGVITVIWTVGNQGNGSLQNCVQVAIDCALALTNSHSDMLTKITGIALRISCCIATGSIVLDFIGHRANRNFMILGDCIADVQKEELQADQVAILQSAWSFIDKARYQYHRSDLHTMLILGISHMWKSEKNTRGATLEILLDKRSPADAMEMQPNIHDYDLRPAIQMAVDQEMRDYLKTFMPAPVSHATDMQEGMEYLSEMRHVVVMVLRINLLYLTDNEIVYTADVCYRTITRLCKEIIRNYSRSEKTTGYDQKKITTNKNADSLECSAEFPAETEVRARKKNRQYDNQKSLNSGE